METYKKLLKYVKPYWYRILGAMFFMLIISITTVTSMWIIKKLFDDVLANKTLESIVKMKMLIVVSFGLVILFFLKGLSRYAQDYLLSNTGHRIVMNIRNAIFSHIQFLSVDFFHKYKSGDLISRITYDTSAIQEAVSYVFSNIIGNGLTIIGLTSYIFWVNWRLALLSMLVFPFAFYLIYYWGRKLRKLSTMSQIKMADMTSVVNESFSGTKIVKIFNMEKKEIGKFKRETRGFFDIAMKDLRVIALSKPVIEFIGACGIAYIVFYAGYDVIMDKSTVGDFMSFLAALLSLYQPVQSLQNVNATIQRGIAASSRIFSILDIKSSVKEVEKPVELVNFNDSIQFNNVSFAYNKRVVLKNINFNIKKGEITAIVGRSGAGKTTLVDLIPRFYDPVDGYIQIDNIDIRNYSLFSLRRHIGMVTQETILFNDTIYNNILYGRDSASQSEVVEAAKIANAHNFITLKPNKYDTIIGERGVMLSGGERQRIAIARAVLKNPPILILDEATSSLDSESEMLVQKALDTLIKGRTTVVIAHRLSTVINADKIIVIDNGKVVDTGMHTELLNKCKIYKKLCKLQFGSFVKDGKNLS